MTRNSHTLPAGDYYVGDPCYCFQDHEAWMQILDGSEYLELPYGEGRDQIVAFGTMHGDGEYRDRQGNSYPVDAGLIGVVPVHVAVEPMEDLHIIHFDTPFVCSESNGVIRLGHVVINTGNAEDDDV